MKRMVFIIVALSAVGTWAMDEVDVPALRAQQEVNELRAEGASTEAPDRGDYILERLAREERIAAMEGRFEGFRNKYDSLAGRARPTTQKLRAHNDAQGSSKVMVTSFEKLTAEVSRTRQLSEIATLISVLWVLIYAVRTYTC